MLRFVRAFLVGAMLFPLLDGMHTHGSVLAYTTPTIWRMAWWVPIEFGLTWIIIATSVPMIEKRVTGNAPTPPSVRRALLELAIFAGVYAFTAWFAPIGAVAMAAILYAAVAARLLWWSEPRDVIFVFASAVLGPAGEALISAMGLFHYNQPDVLGVPLWLPALWAHGGFFARRAMRLTWFGAPENATERAPTIATQVSATQPDARAG